jgi:SpoVK/Ycf46/Vps4 family AAA+-type ATPase
VFVWTLTSGMAELHHDGSRDTRQPMQALEFIERFEEPAIFILKDLHVFFGARGRAADPQVVRKLRDLVPVLKAGTCPQTVVLISPQLDLPRELEKDVSLLDFDLPSEAEIREVLRRMVELNRDRGRIQIALDEEEEERLAKAALGLTLQEAENAFARAMVEDGKLDGDDVSVVVEEKRQVIRKTEILEFVTPNSTFDDVGGLGNLKRWLAKRNGSWLDAARHYGLPFPKGILITGVPGCGKSLSAKCTADLWELPLLHLDVGRIFSGLVGSSEQNMRQALRTAEAVSPSVLWIDEIEKGFGSGAGPGGDSGTSQRVFGTFLTWMQDKVRPVFVIATANSISHLPPEFLRKGRFDEIFFVDLPTRAERIPILRVHLARRLTEPDVRAGLELDDAAIGRLADLSEGYSGAEIEQAIIAALFDAFAERRPVRLEDFERAIQNMVPLSVTQAEQIRAVRDWANLRAVAATAPEDRVELSGALTGAEAAAGAGDQRGGRQVDF